VKALRAGFGRYTAAPMTVKTNAARILDGLGIAYELRAYEVDVEHLSAASVAAKLGVPLDQIWKTLVARGDRNGVCLAVLPASAQLDLKALARASGNRSVATVPLKEVQPLTGYVRGGVTALACKKSYPVFVEETVTVLDRISVSAGMRGLQIVLKPEDYLRATQATLGSIMRSA
jgi:Cys-tRNA(Pro)/Cys-tRNA(Cys) deacylase